MMIIITVPDGLAGALRALIPLVEPVALALAGAFGAGLLLQLGIDVGLKIIQRALSEES
jgi:hypothetical protein